MRKIPTLFVRDYERLITSMDLVSVSQTDTGINATYDNIQTKKGRYLAFNQVTPGCEWVLAGEGVATRKWDGTCVLIQNGEVFKRFDAKHGKTPPPGFIPAQEEADPITGHWPGWVSLKDYPDKWIQEAYDNFIRPNEACDVNFLVDGTYEAVGPKINGNKDEVFEHRLMKHGVHHFPLLSKCPLTFDQIKLFLSNIQMEGIVFHHPDGRMAKIKRSDFGLKW